MEIFIWNNSNLLLLFNVMYFMSILHPFLTPFAETCHYEFCVRMPKKLRQCIIFDNFFS